MDKFYEGRKCPKCGNLERYKCNRICVYCHRSRPDNPFKKPEKSHNQQWFENWEENNYEFYDDNEEI